MNTGAFMTYLSEQGFSGNTIQRYVEAVNFFGRWYQQTNGTLPDPAALTRPDVRQYREHLQAVQRLAPATINARLAALQKFCAWLVETGQINSNPVLEVKRVPEQALAPRWPERKTVAALLRELERSVNNARTVSATFLAMRDRAVVQMLASTGLRVGELCALDLADVQLSERKGSVTVRRGKGNKQRTVPLNGDARQALAPWLKLRTEGECVFCSESGRRLRPGDVQELMSKYGQRAGALITPHGLRHYVGKQLADSGVGLERIAAILGHSRLDTTRRYTLPSERDLEKALEQLEG